MIPWKQAFRPLHEICADIDAELDDHLARGVERLTRDGVAPDEALVTTRSRMGDVSRTRAELIRIALGPRRATAGGVVFIVLVVAMLGWIRTAGAHRALGDQRDVTNALVGDLEHALAALHSVRPAGDLSPAQTVRFIQVRGAIRRELLWTFSRDAEVTLGGLIARCGGLTDEATGRALVYANGSCVAELDVRELESGEEQDVPLPVTCTVFLPSSATPDLGPRDRSH